MHSSVRVLAFATVVLCPFVDRASAQQASAAPVPATQHEVDEAVASINALGASAHEHGDAWEKFKNAKDWYNACEMAVKTWHEYNQANALTKAMVDRTAGDYQTAFAGQVTVLSNLERLSEHAADVACAEH
jgi:hypothetical protein